MRFTVILMLSFILLTTFNIQAQLSKDTYSRSGVLKTPRTAQINLQTIKNDWNPVLQHLEMPVPGSGSYRAYLLKIKEERARNYQPAGPALYRISSDLQAPELLQNFAGNNYNNSVPNDNDVAISNDGMLISVINSTIWIIDVPSSDTAILRISLQAFSDTLGIISGKYDPRVMYDPREDKFVLTFLSGFSDDDTHIIVAFSQTNDPTGIWNLYALPGNPKNNGTWTDYPMISLTQDEMFVTANLLLTGEPWQTGFTETLIWQLDKFSGYTGDPLESVYYDNIKLDGIPIRNLRPVKGGADLYGPNMYFVSNRNFDLSNDTLFFLELSGTMDNPATELRIDYLQTDVPYGVPPVARQPNNHTFDTNDGRILGAFLENNTIQFVANCINPATGLAGVYHGIINSVDNNPFARGAILGDISIDSVDYGYPNISYTGTWEGDNQAIISFDHSSPTINPGFSAIYYNYGAYSDRITIKEGNSYVNILTGLYERWGDYTGSQRKYNEPGKVWVSGNYGQQSSFFRRNATWIAELESNDRPAVGITEHLPLKKAAKLYPNPSEDVFLLDFQMEVGKTIEITLYNLKGQVVKTLLKGNAKKGMNRFTFSTQPLNAGTYILLLRDHHEILYRKTLVVM